MIDFPEQKFIQIICYVISTVNAALFRYAHSNRPSTIPYRLK
jgi:hypothetical protein